MILEGCCKRKIILNKTTKIWLNYAIGALISGILLWSIYLQIEKQLNGVQYNSWLDTGLTSYLMLAILLMPVNLGIETYKWKMMAGTAQAISMLEAFKSILGGIALSIVTPNRIGEYPGRILYLKKKNTIRLISVSILAAFSQFLTLFFFGIIGLIYYNIHYPGFWPQIVLCSAILVLTVIVLIFFRFEHWSKYLEHIRWFRRFQTYGYLLKRFTYKEQLIILALSATRYVVFTAQYLILLRWMNMNLSPAEGFCTAFLFFWAIAVIPSIALAELGIRGKVSLFLFGHFSQNTIGILTATVGLWLINLVIPAIAGSVLLIRLRVLR